MTKKIIIFEGLKGSGKTILTNSLIKHFENACVCGEELTLQPIKHSDYKEIIVDYYKKLIEEFDTKDSDYFFLDRFYFTKWPDVNYESDYYKEIELLLLSKFEVTLILLTIEESTILQRLKDTQNQRESSGWKFNSGGLSIEDEAKLDLERQRFFQEHMYKDTLIQQKGIIDTTDLPQNLDDLKIYLSRVTDLLSL